MNIQPDPDFSRLWKVLLRQGDPDRVPFIEMCIDVPVMEAILGRRMPEMREKWWDAWIEFMYRLGFDYVPVGYRFKNNIFYVPEVLIAARAMHAGMDLLKPLLAESDVPSGGKMVLGTVKGDLHDIGKNLVAMMLEGGGSEVIDLGVDAGPDKFVNTIRDEQPQIVGMSALVTTTMVNMETTIEALAEAGVRDHDRRRARDAVLCR